MKIDGSKISKELLEGLQQKRQQLNFPIKLKIISFQNDTANQSYIKIKNNFAKLLNIDCDVHYLDSNKSSKTLRKEINIICKQKNVFGAIIQLPIPSNLNQTMLINAIPEKIDIDCLTYKNLGRFYQGKETLMPPTVSALDYLINKYNLNLKNVLLIGQGELIGKPISQYLINHKIPFISANQSTQNLDQLCENADTIITGTGQADTVKFNNVKKDAIIFDFGCTKQQTICGDCEANQNFEETCSFFTPVPNGLGPIVIAKLFENLLINLKQ